MRPSYTKTHKKTFKKCITKRNTSSKKTVLFGYPRRIVTDLEHINQALNVHKSTLAQRSWKVMPKDSREVYKIRRKRQIEKQNKECEREDSTSNQNTHGCGCRSSHKQCVTSEWIDDKINMLTSKRRDESSRSSYSNDSASETSCSLTDSDH